MKRSLLFLLLSFATISTQAQFGKILKKGNVDAGKKLVKAATLSDEDMATY